MKHTLKVERDITVTKIALTGKMRSGKDAVAHHLYIAHGFHKAAFGDALKRHAHDVFPWVSELSKPRALYQNFGQLMREIDPQVWVKHAERTVEGIISLRTSMSDAEIGVVISDLRQPNEFSWARANGFTVIRVTAPDEARLARAKAAGDDFREEDLAHETEQHADGFAVDYEIANDGTIEDLRKKVDAIMARINSL